MQCPTRKLLHSQTWMKPISPYALLELHGCKRLKQVECPRFCLSWINSTFKYPFLHSWWISQGYKLPPKGSEHALVPPVAQSVEQYVVDEFDQPELLVDFVVWLLAIHLAHFYSSFLLVWFVNSYWWLEFLQPSDSEQHSVSESIAILLESVHFAVGITAEVAD